MFDTAAAVLQVGPGLLRSCNANRRRQCVCCRCAETDAEVQRCLSALRQRQAAADDVPDTRQCRRSSDVLVTAGRRGGHDVAAATRSHSTERVTRSSSFPSHQDDATNFNIRDYLIDRCVADTDAAAVATAAADSASAADDDDSDDVDGDDKTDNGPSCSSEPLQDADERSTKPPLPSLPSQRFSDSQLLMRQSATLPGRPAGSMSESRAKRHRWKLLRKAMNLFSLDEMADAGGDAVTSACDGDAAAHSSDEAHLNSRSVSVESLPGSVQTSATLPTPSVIRCVGSVISGVCDFVCLCVCALYPRSRRKTT